jgi:hypothetical protein
MVAAFEEHVHTCTADSLGCRNRAVTVSEKKRLQVDDFLTELCHSLGQGVILGAEELDFGLQVGEPLLLALSTLERGDTA